MVKTKLIKIVNIKSKIIQGKFGDGRYYGYTDKKLISLVKITLNNKQFGFGESLVGIYSPKLFQVNVDYLSKYFVGKNIDEAFIELKKLQDNKFFFNQGILKSILSSLEIALISCKSKNDVCSFAETVNKIYLKSKFKKSKFVEIYASAGSIKSSIKNLINDFKFAKSLNINRVKIRLNLNKDFSKIIRTIKNYTDNYAIDLIANTFKPNNNKKKLIQFLRLANKNKFLWLEEPVGVESIGDSKFLSKYNNIFVSYGENFTAYYDYLMLLKLRYIKFINVDVSHCSISDLIKLILFIRKNKIKKKIILHCWGSIINLNASIEVASLFKNEIYMVEFPITKFELNDFYISSVKIKNSRVKTENYLTNVENKYNKLKINKISEKNKFRFA